MRKWLGFGAAAIAAPLLMGAPGVQAASIESILHVFNGTNGQSPSGTLVQDAAGNLYGITGRGGTINASCPSFPAVSGSKSPDGCGLVFKLVPPAAGKTAWTEDILYEFSGADGGFYPGVDDRRLIGWRRPDSQLMFAVPA